MSLFTKIKSIKQNVDKTKKFLDDPKAALGLDRDNVILEQATPLTKRVFNVEQLKANMGTGLARPNRYVALISSPRVLVNENNQFLVYRTTGAALPGKNLFTSQSKPIGYGPIVRYPYQNSYGQLDITFLTDSDYKEYKYFSLWTDSIVKGATNKTFSRGGYHLNNYRDDYRCLISLFGYNDEGISTYSCFFADAFPRDIQPVTLGWDQNDQVLQFTVTFDFTHWYDQDTPEIMIGKKDIAKGGEVDVFTNLLESGFSAMNITGAGASLPQDIRDAKNALKDFF